MRSCFVVHVAYEDSEEPAHRTLLVAASTESEACDLIDWRLEAGEEARYAQPADITGPCRRGPLHEQLEGLRQDLADAAQGVYDSWDQTDEQDGDPYIGFGGICDPIAAAMAGVIGAAIDNADVRDGGHDGDDHAYLQVHNGTDEIYMVDIPFNVYETGSMLRYEKRPDVRIAATDVIIEPLDVEVIGEHNAHEW